MFTPMWKVLPTFREMSPSENNNVSVYSYKIFVKKNTYNMYEKDQDLVSSEEVWRSPVI